MLKKNTLSLLFISLATSLFTLDMGIISIALLNIESNFSTTKSVTSWIITIFSISSAIGIISLGFLSKIFGRKYIYLTSVLGFTIFSSLCGCSITIENLLFLRAFQGFFGSGLVALSQAIVVDISSKDNRSKAISIWTFGLLAGPVFGPLFGGFLVEYLDWRWIFFINLPLGLIAFFGLLINLKKDYPTKNYTINIIGFFSLGISVACLQIVLDRGEFEDWFNSRIIVMLSITSLLSITSFFLNSYFSKSPLFPSLLFKDRFFIGGIIFAFLFGFILIPPFILMPIFLTEIQSFPIYLVGIILSFSALGGMIATFFISFIIRKIGNICTMLLGLFIFILSNLEVAFWTTDISTNHIILNNIFRGISISTFYVPLAAITYTTLPNNLRTEAASLFQFLRTLGTGSAVAIFITLLNYNYKVHYENIIGSINYKHYGLRSFLNNENILAHQKIYLTRLTEYYSNLNSIISDFYILAFTPIIFLPFFFMFLKK